MTRLPKGRYSSRSSAIRAARAACRKALNSPIYSAYEGHDFDVCEDTMVEINGATYWFTFRFRLVGPAAEAATNPALATGFSA